MSVKTNMENPRGYQMKHPKYKIMKDFRGYFIKERFLRYFYPNITNIYEDTSYFETLEKAKLFLIKDRWRPLFSSMSMSMKKKEPSKLVEKIHEEVSMMKIEKITRGVDNYGICDSCGAGLEDIKCKYCGDENIK